MKTVTKKQVVLEISNKQKMDPKNVQAVVQDLLDLVTENLEKGNRFELRNFGVFEVVDRKAKVGRNPKSPEIAISIPARRVVKFSPGRKMKRSVTAEL